jgi:hypothetical protein
MDTLQPTLFDDNGKARAAGSSIVHQAKPGRPLSKKQKTFNGLIQKIERSRSRLDRLKRSSTTPWSFMRSMCSLASSESPRYARTSCARSAPSWTILA